MEEILERDDLEGFVHRLAARTALMIVSSRDDPDLVERLSDFLQDRGAVGILLQRYEAGDTLEEVALSFWNSRIEKNAARFEDLVTAILIAVISTVVGNIILDMWKGDFGLLANLIGDGKKDRARLKARKEPQIEDFKLIFPFYALKKEGKGVTSASVADSLHRHITKGGKFSEFPSGGVDGEVRKAKFAPLIHATEVAQGVVKTEFQSWQKLRPTNYFRDKVGLTLSERTAFGEVICLFDCDDLGIGSNWPTILKQKLKSRQLYPEHWPAEIEFGHVSPKILILDDNVLRRIQKSHNGYLLTMCAGLISTGPSGMIGHIAVLSRSLGIAGLSCFLTEEECLSAKFALIQSGSLRLYNDRPNLTQSDFTYCLSLTNRMHHPGD